MIPSRSDHDIPIVVATKEITQSGRRAALAAVVALFAGTMIWAPFASVQLARIDVFIPVIQSRFPMFCNSWRLFVRRQSTDASG